MMLRYDKRDYFPEMNYDGTYDVQVKTVERSETRNTLSYHHTRDHISSFDNNLNKLSKEMGFDIAGEIATSEHNTSDNCSSQVFFKNVMFV